MSRLVWHFYFFCIPLWESWCSELCFKQFDTLTYKIFDILYFIIRLSLPKTFRKLLLSLLTTNSHCRETTAVSFSCCCFKLTTRWASLVYILSCCGLRCKLKPDWNVRTSAWALKEQKWKIKQFRVASFLRLGVTTYSLNIKL